MDPQRLITGLITKPQVIEYRTSNIESYIGARSRKTMGALVLLSIFDITLCVMLLVSNTMNNQIIFPKFKFFIFRQI